MQHEYFITDGNKQMGQMFAPGGVGGSDQILGATYSEYGGLIWGLRSDTNIVSDYFGLAEMWSIGLSFDVGIGLGVGVTRVSSFSDPKIRAWLAYRSISVGADLFPILLDAGAGAINMAQFKLGNKPTTFGTDYLHNGKINESGLYRDILTGQKSVWLSDRWPSIPGNPAMNQYKSDSGKMRAIGLATAMHYVKVYKELRWGFPEFEFPFGLGEVY